MADKKNSVIAVSIKMVLVLFLISAVTAGVVAAVNAMTEEKIAENLEMEIRNSFIAVFGEGVEYKSLDSIPKGLEAVYEITANGSTYYSANINSSGFGGDINILTSFGTDGKIIGVSIVTHSETPGIGTRVTDNSFTSKFKDKTLANQVDSLSGATISSNALKDGISTAQKILSEAGLIFITTGGVN